MVKAVRVVYVSPREKLRFSTPELGLIACNFLTQENIRLAVSKQVGESPESRAVLRRYHDRIFFRLFVLFDVPRPMVACFTDTCALEPRPPGMFAYDPAQLLFRLLSGSVSVVVGSILTLFNIKKFLRTSFGFDTSTTAPSGMSGVAKREFTMSEVVVGVGGNPNMFHSLNDDVAPKTLVGDPMSHKHPD